MREEYEVTEQSTRKTLDAQTKDSVDAFDYASVDEPPAVEVINTFDPLDGIVIEATSCLKRESKFLA